MTKTMHTELERDLRELFERQHQAVTPTDREWDATEPLVVVELTSHHVGHRRRVAVTAAALVASAAIVTTAVAVAGHEPAVKTTPGGIGTRASNSRASDSASSSSAAPSTASPPSDVTPATEGKGAAEWNTPQVRLTVSGFSITTTSDAGTLVFTDSDHPGEPDTTPVFSASGDPGSNTHQTLELRWNEHGREQRWYIDFASDGADWWATEMRTYDGQLPTSDWVVFAGERFRTPLGSSWSGPLDVTASAHGVTSELRMNIEHLQAFVGLG